ncbi:MAG TPA: DUF4179 domain-containing protein [Firmicutes bacterium]|nr:DUF4179 domain-containing protein [Candidatus Fermentithermobacillaceae bacterium]
MNSYNFDHSESDLAVGIKKALSAWLSEVSPRHGVLDFARQKRSRYRSPLEVIRDAVYRLPRVFTTAPAVIVILTLFIFSLVQIPLVARAFSSIPAVGKAYQDFLEWAGLDVAYQAGVINEIRKTITQSGITVEVIGAICDGTQTVVYYTVGPSDSSGASSVDEQLDGLMLTSKLYGGGWKDEGIASYFYPVDGRYFCVIREKPVSWIARLLGAKLTLMVQAVRPTDELPGLYGVSRNISPVYTWKVSFPVQTITGEAETIKIGKTIISGNDKFTLTEIVFAPTQTILRFEIEALSEDISAPFRDPGTNRWPRLGDCFSLVTSDGKSIPYYGNNLSNESDKRKCEAYFWPTTRRDISVLFKELLTEPNPLQIPLREGVSVKCTVGGSIEITEVDTLETVTRVTLKYTGNLTLHDADIRLRKVTGDEVAGEERIFTRCTRHLDSRSVQYTFVPGFDANQYEIWVFPYFLEIEGTPVFEVQGPSASYSYRLNTRHAFCPPKPNEFFRAARTSAFLAPSTT